MDPRRRRLRPSPPEGVDPRASDTRIRASLGTDPLARPRSSESRLRSRPHQPPDSGEYALRYTLIRQILRAYLSGIIVDSVLDKAMRERDLTPAALSHADLVEMTSDIMVGLRLFVEEERLPQLMLELAEVLEGDG